MNLDWLGPENSQEIFGLVERVRPNGLFPLFFNIPFLRDQVVARGAVNQLERPRGGISGD